MELQGWFFAAAAFFALIAVIRFFMNPGLGKETWEGCVPGYKRARLQEQARENAKLLRRKYAVGLLFSGLALFAGIMAVLPASLLFVPIGLGLGHFMCLVYNFD